MSIGKRLQELRQHLGDRKELTQSEMARLMNASLRAYQNYERDQRQPRVEQLAELQAHKVNINWLISGTGNLFIGDPEEGRSSAGSRAAKKEVDPSALSAVIDVVWRALDEENITLRTPALAELIVLVHDAVSDAIAKAEASMTADPAALASSNLARLLPLMSRMAEVESHGDSVFQLPARNTKRKGPRKTQR